MGRSNATTDVMNCIKHCTVLIAMALSLSVHGQYSLPDSGEIRLHQLPHPAQVYSRAWDSNAIRPIKSHALPLFCEWERKIEQNTQLPFRFRLGNVKYVDDLEKKWQGHRN